MKNPENQRTPLKRVFAKTVSSVLAVAIFAQVLPMLAPPVMAAETQDAQWEEISSILTPMTAKHFEPQPISAAVQPAISTGMLLGNGALGVVSDARENQQSYYLATGDAWTSGGTKVMNAQLKFTNMPSAMDNIPTATVSNNNASDGSKGAAACFDGDTNTYWVSQSEWQNKGARTLTIAFDDEVTIDKWKTCHRQFNDTKGTRFNTREFKLQTSTDKTTWTDVDHVENNEEKEVIRELEKPVTSKYFRLDVIKPVQPGYETQTDGANKGDRAITRIGEIDFYFNGKSIIHTATPEVPPPTPETGTAFTFTFSDTPAKTWSNFAANVFDDNVLTAWRSDHQIPKEARYDKKEVPKDKWVCAKGSEPFTFDNIEVRHSGARYPEEAIYNTYNYELQTSDDGQTWQTIKKVTANTEDINTFSFANPITTTYFRLITGTPVNPEYESKYVNKDMACARICDIILYDGNKNIIIKPEIANDNYLHEQDILNAEVRSKLKFDEAPLNFRSWTADEKNILFTDVTLDDTATEATKIYAEFTAPNAMTRTNGVNGDIIWLTRTNGTVSGGSYASNLVSATKVISGSSKVSGKRLEITLQPGETATLATYANSSSGFGNSPDEFKAKALDTVKTETIDYLNALTEDEMLQLHEDHLSWWKDYWLRSYVNVESESVQKYYFGALYAMGCSVRPTPEGKTQPNVPASMCGIWQTMDVNSQGWLGQGYTNYNYEAPYYGMSSSNRGDLLIPYYEEAAIRVSREQGAVASRGYQGSQIRRVIHPVWNFYNKAELREVTGAKRPTALRDITDQKSNIMLYTMPLIWDWQYNRDEERLVKDIYPTIELTAKFYMDFVVMGDDGKYWILNSSNNETNANQPQNQNAALDMGYIQTHFAAFIEMSKHLDKNQEAVAKMEEILANMSPYATSENSVPAKAEFEKCNAVPSEEVLLAAYSADNDTQRDAANCEWASYIYEGNQPVILEGLVHPGDNVSLSSEPGILKLAKDTFEYMNPTKVHYRGASFNGFPKSFTIGARLGMDADKLLNDFEIVLDNLDRDNLTVCNSHGLEFTGAIESVNSMLLQNEDNELRVFPAWPESKDAKFVKLRAKGAFLVSAEQASGKVNSIEITSEKGLPLTVVSPWSGAKVTGSAGNVVPYTDGTTAYTKEKTIVFETKPGETYTLVKGEQSEMDTLAPVLTTAGGKITLLAMAGEAGDSFLYKTTAATDAANQPAYNSENLAGYKPFSRDTAITGAGGKEIFVQVIRVNGRKIKAWGETSTAPAFGGYTVTFCVDGKITTKTAKKGEIIEMPADPMKKGYLFNGWFTEETGGELVEAFVATQTVYAQWTADGASVDKTELTAAIANANVKRAAAAVSVDGADVASTAKWVLQEVMDDYNDAIAAAQEVVDFAEATTAEVSAAVVTLAGATKTFTAALKPGSSATAIDKTALNVAISKATTNTATISVDGTDVASSEKWVTQAVMDDYTAAITAAQAVADKADATKTEVSDAIAALADATTAFNSAKVSGTKPAPVDKTALKRAVTAANNNKGITGVSVDGADIEATLKWVTQAVMDDYTNAITAANDVVKNEDTTKTEVSDAIVALADATTAFNSAKTSGTMPPALVDRSPLERKIAQAKSIRAGAYTAKSFAALQAAIGIAEAALDTVETQDEVTAAVAALQRAINALVTRPTSRPEPTPEPDKNTAGGGKTPNCTSDTMSDMTVNGGYQFKITSTDGRAPKFVLDTPGVFEVQLVAQSGNDYFYKVIAIGMVGNQAGVYLNDGSRLLVLTVGTSTAAGGVKSDTTTPITVAINASYTFQLTASKKPEFTAGSKSFTVTFVKHDGNHYYFKVKPVGKVGDGCGFYINDAKAPVSVATIK